MVVTSSSNHADCKILLLHFRVFFVKFGSMHAYIVALIIMWFDTCRQFSTPLRKCCGEGWLPQEGRARHPSFSFSRFEVAPTRTAVEIPTAGIMVYLVFSWRIRKGPPPICFDASKDANVSMYAARMYVYST